jgi:diaminopimelate decarboxylase
MPSPSSADNRFRLTDSQAKELAESYGTPLYVLSEQAIRERMRSYRQGFMDAYKDSNIVYASKANSTLAVLVIAEQEGCLIDVASEGELRAAILAGVPASKCHFHGNNKQASELAFAFEAGVGEIIVDNVAEIELIYELARTDEPASKIVSEALGVPTRTRSHLKCPDLMLRLAPGVDPITHSKISTGQEDTKFGFNIGDGSAEKAVRRCLELHLPLIGFHCHVGSQLLDPEAQCSGGEIITEFAKDMKAKLGFKAKVLNVGGGLGIRYVDSDNPTPVDVYNKLIVQSILKKLDDDDLNPTLIQEPGRSLIAECGVTLYTVGVVKTVPTGEGSTRTYVCVDGGLSDNPRPALYGSKYTVERVAKIDEEGAIIVLDASQKTQTVTVSGKHCETDKLFIDIELPTDTESGDLLQVLCTGAYNNSMASNYNRYRRPATILVREDGTYNLVQRTETWDEMYAREVIPPGLRN